MKVYEFQLRAVLNWLYTLFTIKNYDLFKKWPYSREKYWPSESLVNSFYRNHWPVKSWLLIITHRHGVPLETPAFRVNSKFRNISLEWCAEGEGEGRGSDRTAILIRTVYHNWSCHKLLTTTQSIHSPSSSLSPLPPSYSHQSVDYAILGALGALRNSRQLYSAVHASLHLTQPLLQGFYSISPFLPTALAAILKK